MSVYGWILIGSLAGPLFLSTASPVYFYRRWRQVLIAILGTAVPFWVWDIFVTARGDWSFNSAYTSSLKWFGLPLEEWLFFVVIPFCCLFIYEVVRVYWKDRLLTSKRNARIMGSTVSALFVLGAIVWRDQSYTSLVCVIAAALSVVLTILVPHWFVSKQKLITHALVLLAFLVVNFFLTFLPVVQYNREAILNVRLISIPIEDIIYNYALLFTALLWYRAAYRFSTFNHD